MDQKVIQKILVSNSLHVCGESELSHGFIELGFNLDPKRGQY